MSPTFTPIRLTIIDFLGVFLPGMVWTVLFFTLREMVSHEWGIKPTDPLKVAFFIATLPKKLPGHKYEYGTAFYFGLALLSILIGYFNMALSTSPAEWTSFHVARLIRRMDSQKNRPIYFLFPYKDYYEKKQESLYSSIKEIVNSELQIGKDSPTFKIEKLASYQPFETCKRLLKIRQPALWEEAQYREAQVRMLASLFLASLFNLVLAVFNLVLAVTIWEKLSWLLISLFITFIVGHTFRNRRFREVEDVYISTLLVRNSVPPSSNP